MNFSKYKKRAEEIYKNFSFSECTDNEIEAYYTFLDEVTESAKDNSALYEIAADLWYFIGSPQKARFFFEKCYDKKNRKHLEKMYKFRQYSLGTPLARPGDKGIKIPKFTYTQRKPIAAWFEKIPNEKCCICGKENKGLYIGKAYRLENGRYNEIIYFDSQRHFCGDCIKNGSAAENENIIFNDPVLLECSGFDANEVDEILKRTPFCSEFSSTNEDVWADHCGCLCEYKGTKNGIASESYIFVCRKCGEKVYMKK